MFTDRSDAAQQLVAALRQRDVVGDVVVTLAPNGVPVGNVVADATGLPWMSSSYNVYARQTTRVDYWGRRAGRLLAVNRPTMRSSTELGVRAEAKTHASDPVESRRSATARRGGRLTWPANGFCWSMMGFRRGRRCVSQFSVCERRCERGYRRCPRRTAGRAR